MTPFAGCALGVSAGARLIAVTNILSTSMLALLAVVAGDGWLNECLTAQKPDPTFPDGLVHDFGKVQRGSQVYHTFRIVNTAKVPLHISSIRVSMGRGTSARSSKNVLQPNEEGTVEVAMDTRQFV